MRGPCNYHSGMYCRVLQRRYYSRFCNRQTLCWTCEFRNRHGHGHGISQFPAAFIPPRLLLRWAVERVNNGIGADAMLQAVRRQCSQDGLANANKDQSSVPRQDTRRTGPEGTFVLGRAYYSRTSKSWAAVRYADESDNGNASGLSDRIHHEELVRYTHIWLPVSQERERVLPFIWGQVWVQRMADEVRLAGVYNRGKGGRHALLATAASGRRMPLQVPRCRVGG